MTRQAILYMMFGYPGAGKTTTAEIIARHTGAVHLSSDKLRLDLFPEPGFSPEEHGMLYKELDTQTEVLLRQGKDVIYDANLNRRVHRKEKYDICRRTGAQPLLIWVQTERETAKQRALHDSRSPLWPKHERPSQMFDRIADIIEAPDQDEPVLLLDGTKITPEYIRTLLQL